MTDIDQISGDVLDLALRIHRELGPGLLESVYETVLAGKLAAMGYRVDRQKPVDIVFEGLRFDAAFRIDLLVDERLLVEIKSVERLNGAHAKQLLSYLRAHEPVRWAADQLWGRDVARRRSPHRQRFLFLRASAPPRLRVNQNRG